MAESQLITGSNYTTLLKQSSSARNGAPDGNVYFDIDNNQIQLIGYDELPQIDFGSGLEDNPLTNYDGITLQAIYLFENARRRVDETLRQYFRDTGGVYKFSGAFIFNNGASLANNDRNKIRQSGWIEYAGDRENISRIYFGVKSLVPIQMNSDPYWTLVESGFNEADLQSATWSNFFRSGPIDETIQVYGNTSHGDVSAGNFDYTQRTLVIRLRPFGSEHVQVTSTETGITEFSGYSTGFGIGENDNAFNSYDYSDVYGVGQILPWTGMSLEKLDVAQVETGFNENDGNFTWVLKNVNGGTVDECVAFLDALQMQDSNIDSGTGTYNGRKGRRWYSRNAQGKVVTSSISGYGLFIEGLSTSEKQNIIMTDDAGEIKTYPFYPEIRINVGSIAKADPKSWYHVFYRDGAFDFDFDKSGAVTVKDANGVDVKGMASSANAQNIISFTYDYDNNTQAGLNAGDDKDCVVLVEGDGGAAQALTEFTIVRNTIISVVCQPSLETNA